MNLIVFLAFWVSLIMMFFVVGWRQGLSFLGLWVLGVAVAVAFALNPLFMFLYQIALAIVMIVWLKLALL